MHRKLLNKENRRMIMDEYTFAVQKIWSEVADMFYMLYKGGTSIPSIEEIETVVKEAGCRYLEAHITVMENYIKDMYKH